MDSIADIPALSLLLGLLPGFITAEIVGHFVVKQERSALDRVIQALIFTYAAHLIWAVVGRLVTADPTATSLVGVGFSALGLGLILTWVINSDRLHSFLRRVRLTRAASRPSEWYDAFYERPWHVILHLADNRRIMGWPLLWPHRADKGHMFLQRAQWLGEKADEGTVAYPLSDYLISVGEIRFVEFLQPKPD